MTDILTSVGRALQEQYFPSIEDMQRRQAAVRMGIDPKNRTELFKIQKNKNGAWEYMADQRDRERGNRQLLDEREQPFDEAGYDRKLQRENAQHAEEVATERKQRQQENREQAWKIFHKYQPIKGRAPDKISLIDKKSLEMLGMDAPREYWNYWGIENRKRL